MRQYINVTRNGNDIYHKFIDENGNRVARIEKFHPTLFLKDKTKTSTTRSMVGKVQVRELIFNGINDYSAEVKKYKDIGGFGVYGEINPVYQFINAKYPDKIDFDFKKMKTIWVDIETAYDPGIFPEPQFAKYAILTISCYDSLKDEYIIFHHNPKGYHNDNALVMECDDEKDMLTSFLDYWKLDDYPDNVVGWNSEKFDLPYIYNRIKKVLSAKDARSLSPIYKVYAKTKQDKKFFKDYLSVNIQGINHLDMMEFYEKFTWDTRVSYSLDNVAFEEMGSRKIDYSEYGNLMNLFRENFDLYCTYNLRDVSLMVEINDKIKLFDLVLQIAYFSKINLVDTLSPVKTWDVVTYNYIKEDGLVLEPNLFHDSEEYGGGYVMDPKPGMYKDIISIDAKSEYPNLVRWLNIGNETIRDTDNGNCTKSTAGYYFDKSEQSVYSKMITDVFDRRVATKKIMKQKKIELAEIRRLINEKT